MINAAIAIAYEDIAKLASLVSICYQYPKMDHLPNTAQDVCDKATKALVMVREFAKDASGNGGQG
jgi:hypothetical protein